MPNPVTDGQLGDETPPFVERALAVVLAGGIVVLEYRLGLWPPRLGIGVAGIVTLATACVWFPDSFGHMTDRSGLFEADLSPTGVRLGGWALLIFVAIGFAVTWLLRAHK